jgi:hypothetical protein
MLEEGSGIFCCNCDKEVDEKDVIMMDFGAIYDFCSEECFFVWDADRLGSMIDDAHERERDGRLSDTR